MALGRRATAQSTAGGDLLQYRYAEAAVKGF
jgi:hypothetical protein